GMTGLDYYSIDATVANDRLYVSGLQRCAGNGASGVRVNGVCAWDGSSWSTLASGVSGPAYSLGTLGTQVVLGGSFQISTIQAVARWDGSAWSSFGAGSAQLANSVSGLAEHQGSLYAAGEFSLGGSWNVARWDGGAWQGLGTGVGGINDFATTLVS